MCSVSIVMGSDSDLEIMKEAAEELEYFDLDYELRIISAHRTPEMAEEYARMAESRGIQVIIAGAGKAAHLPGVIAAYTVLPVIGVPIRTSSLAGADSLYSMVQMPTGVPVATVALDGARNAALLTIQILGIADHNLRERFKGFKEEMAKRVKESDQKLQKLGYKEYLKQRR